MAREGLRKNSLFFSRQLSSRIKQASNIMCCEDEWERGTGGRKGKYDQWKCSLASHSVQFSFCVSSTKLKLQSFYVTFSNPGIPSITSLLQVIKLCWVFPTSLMLIQCSSRNGFFGDQYSPFLSKARNLLFHEELCHSNTIYYLYLKCDGCDALEYGHSHKMPTTFQESHNVFNVHEAPLDVDRNPSR